VITQIQKSYFLAILLVPASFFGPLERVFTEVDSSLEEVLKSLKIAQMGGSSNSIIPTRIRRR
jgi:hypothetical protein